MPWVKYNPNPTKRSKGDCVVRAICKATGEEWETIYWDLCLKGSVMGDWGCNDAVWSDYLRSKGFERFVIPNSCPDCYTVIDFCKDHPEGMYILCISGHVVTVYNGSYFDSFDSGDEIPSFYWVKKKEGNE